MAVELHPVWPDEARALLARVADAGAHAAPDDVRALTARAMAQWEVAHQRGQPRQPALERALLMALRALRPAAATGHEPALLLLLAVASDAPEPMRQEAVLLLAEALVDNPWTPLTQHRAQLTQLASEPLTPPLARVCLALRALPEALAALGALLELSQAQLDARSLLTVHRALAMEGARKDARAMLAQLYQRAPWHARRDWLEDLARPNTQPPQSHYQPLIPLLLALAQDAPDQLQVVEAVISALGRIGDVSAQPFLLTTLQHGPIALRVPCLIALSLCGDRRALPVFDKIAPQLTHDGVRWVILAANSISTRATPLPASFAGAGALTEVAQGDLLGALSLAHLAASGSLSQAAVGADALITTATPHTSPPPQDGLASAPQRAALSIAALPLGARRGVERPLCALLWVDVRYALAMSAAHVVALIMPAWIGAAVLALSLVLMACLVLQRAAWIKVLRRGDACVARVSHRSHTSATLALPMSLGGAREAITPAPASLALGDEVEALVWQDRAALWAPLATTLRLDARGRLSPHDARLRAFAALSYLCTVLTLLAYLLLS